MKLAAGIAVAWCAATAALAQHEVRLERIATVTADGGNTMAAAFAPNGKALAMGGERGDLFVLDLPARTRRWFAAPSDHWIGTLAFSPDGRVLACCGRHLTLHDAATGRELDRWPDTGPHGFAWKADGSRYAFAHRGGLTAVDAKGRAATAVDFEYPVNALAYAVDGTLFAGDNVGRLWRLAPGAPAPELLFRHRTKENTVSAIAVAWADGVVFDVASSGPLRRGDIAFEVPGRSFAFGVSPDGRSFAVGGEPRVRWWRDGGAKSSDLATSDRIAALAVHPDGRTLFVSTCDGHQELRRDDGTAIELPGHAAQVHNCALSPDGSVLAIQGKLWSMQRNTWSMQPVLGGAPRFLPGACKVRAGRRGSELLVQYAKRLVLVDGNTGVETVAIDTEEGFRCSDTVLGPGQRLLCGASGEWIDLATKARTNVPERLRLEILDSICEVASACNGTWAIGVCSGMEVYYGSLWVTDAEGQTLHANEDGPVYCLAFSPDGKRLYYTRGERVTLPPDRVLCVRDTADFRLLHQVRARIGSWRFLDEGHALTTVNGQLQVWDVTTLRPVQTVSTDEPMHEFKSSEDCRILASSNGREVLVYRLHRGD